MFFITTLYFPDFKSKPYLTLIEQKLKEGKTLNWNHAQYLRLLDLKKHASQAAASFSQLNALFENNEFPEFEQNILKAVKAAIENKDISPFENNIRNSFARIKDSLSDRKEIRGCSSVCNLVTNSITTTVGLAAICVAAIAISTCGIGAIFMGMVIALLATAITLLAAYSLYVDGRYLANKQVEEIDSFIDNLFSYNRMEPRQVNNPPTTDPLDLGAVYIPNRPELHDEYYLATGTGYGK